MISLRNIIKLSAVVLIFLLSSCVKDELKLPAKVNFEFELISHEAVEEIKAAPVYNSNNQRVVIDDGKLNLGMIEFDGRRDEGQDVYFSSNFTQPLIADLGSGQTNINVAFDIAQGVYNFIEIYIHLVNNGNIPLVLEGVFFKGPPNHDAIPIIIEFPLRERIRVRAEPKKNTSEKIVLKKDVVSTATVFIDAGVIFQFINMSVLINAETTTIEGDEVILINPDFNSSIFDLIAMQLEKSFKVIIE